MIGSSLRYCVVVMILIILSLGASASPEVQWGITVDDGAVCRLETRFSGPKIKTDESRIVFIFGFLSYPIVTPIGELPAGQIIVSVEFAIPKSEELLIPTGLTVNGEDMAIFQWGAPSTLDQYFFSLADEGADRLFASASRGSNLAMVFELSDGSKHEETIRLEGSENFHIYAAMLEACGEKLKAP